MFLDPTVHATFHILELYNHLIRDDKENALYSNLTNGELAPEKEIIKATDISQMIRHTGQMGGEYPLSPSQREVITHFSKLQPGDILAVNGPPGTGKTTVLQSIVSTMYVNSALKQEKVPIIVASSTNNQAVTNIIDSFGKINEIGISNLEKRWITGTHSFSTYFPSKGRIEEAKNSGYQYTDIRGAGFIEQLESKENREMSKSLFLNECSKFFDLELSNLLSCSNAIWETLKQTDTDRQVCLTIMKEMQDILGNKNYISYCDELKDDFLSLQQDLESVKSEIVSLRQSAHRYAQRYNEWRNSYNSLPRYVRLFKFLPAFKSRISSWSYSFIHDDELAFLNRNMRIDEIESVYREKIDALDLEIQNLELKVNALDNTLYRIEEKLNEIEKLFTELKENFFILNEFSPGAVDNEKLAEFDIVKLNEKLDMLRYIEFWLSVHYYECRWLIEENPITDKQKGRTFANVLTMLYHRLAMISPCLVMTFYMLPKQFLAYNGDENNHYYMYDFIDLLIIDEAGQISPEIAAPSFSLAKKAVVVGDENQIPPVWSTTTSLDISMAVSKGLISGKNEFSKLQENGLNCSESSIMKVASLSCPYNTNGHGLFLREHHRCYDEIIEYCNRLVYDGLLIPLRGSSNTPKNPLYGYLPSMGFKQLSAATSKRIGCSRQNYNEAHAIIQWLKANYIDIIAKYTRGSEGTVNTKELLGIITPFKAQSILIRRLLKAELPEQAQNISVGTVHTFQGGEKKIIIFSTVYGHNDGCFFINRNKSLMNVAVSRAKDAFLVFGDLGCLTGSPTSSAGLLKSFLTEITI